jgi:5S rRNA maturation endonuclease (ribonuclease M5)
VFVVEGEKDVHTLERWGIVATTNSGGANQPWLDTYSQSLKGANVVIIPDNDEPGRKHAEKIAAGLQGIAKSVRVVALPNVADKADVSDWVESGATKQELLALVKGARPWTPAGREEVDAWEDPVPFEAKKLPPFPTDTLPAWLREFVEAEAEATQTPVDLAALLSLAAVAAACARKVEIYPTPSWRVPLNIYAVVALPSGTRKSAVFEHVTAPLYRFEREQAKLLGSSIRKARVDADLMEDELKELKKQLKAVNDAKKRATLEERIHALTERREKLNLPKVPQLVVDDCTAEKLETLLHDYGRIAFMSPEGGVFDLMAGRYGGEANFEVFLKGHSGDFLSVHRINRDAVRVERPAITMALAVQPAVLRGLAERPGFRGKGLLARPLYAIPENLVGRRNANATPMADATRRAYEENIQALLRLETTPNGRGEAVPQVLHLTPDAQDLVTRMLNQIEPRLAQDGDLHAIADWAGKLVGTTVAVAGLLHMAQQAPTIAAWNTRITASTMRHAIRIAGYLIPHAKAAFHQMGLDPSVDGAQYILARIRRWSVGTAWSQRELLRRCERFQSVAEPLGRSEC